MTASVAFVAKSGSIRAGALPVWHCKYLAANIARDTIDFQNLGAKSGALALPYLAGSASALFLGAIIWGISGCNTLLSLLTGLAAAGCALYVVSHRLAVQA
jgi:hypothetical protein